jgi:putative RecB family exonuclease
MRASYSTLSTYQQCPQKYKFQEIDRIRVPKGIEAVFGNIIHSCLKFMFSRSPLYPTLDEIIDRFRGLWEIKNGIEITPDDDKAYLEEGVSILKNFYKSNQPWNFNVLDLEAKFEVLIPDPVSGESHILAGIIDRVDKNSSGSSPYYEIIDYKTSRRMPPQENLDDDLQMSIYNLGVIKRWPHLKTENVKLSLYFLKHGEKITTSRSLENLEKTKILIINLINEIKEKIKNCDFPAFPSPLCEWCGYKPMCPMWKHQFQKSSPCGRSPEGRQNEIEEIIREYFDLKEQNNKNNQRLKELQISIYEFMSSEGVERVFGENGYLTKTLQERLIYDMNKIEQILVDLGRWNEVVKKKQFSILKASKKKI